MRLIIATILLLGFSVSGMSQSCGYTFLTIYLKDSAGALISNAEIQIFDSHFTKKETLHFHENSYDSLITKGINWTDKKQAFFGSEGMCSGHNDIGLRITAKGFEPSDNVIDLPLGWTSYSITLRKPGSTQKATATKLADVEGVLKDKNGERVPEANIFVFAGSRKMAQTASTSYGNFGFDLPTGNYSIVLRKNGYRRLILTNFEISNPESKYLEDLILNSDDRKNSVNPAEEYLDYRTINKKTVTK